MPQVPFPGEYFAVEPLVPTVYDDDDGIVGYLYGPDGESIISILYRPFGYARTE